VDRVVAARLDPDHVYMRAVGSQNKLLGGEAKTVRANRAGRADAAKKFAAKPAPQTLRAGLRQKKPRV